MTKQNTAAVEAVKARLAATDTPNARAKLLFQLTEAIYEHTKLYAPGGEGADGLDGPERRSLGLILDKVRDHQFATLENVQETHSERSS